ncbi:MAG: hypothetical protein BWY04_01391 [candidate division CPR1 bacterium ADurb.Bin160]|uniref:Uncharacterized protein n=1 Tax=candidate division CPR1 bacterium ADurb.Bin160 TaxID=1852826 RepID=A0A1V5ZJP5_9BACT|nr:MAG: hypothetical protein BWY04_01391 [candidate division CPR1 bacterium ADurb.Bin160]
MSKEELPKFGEDFTVDNLTASFGLTINLGDYESLRIDKSVSIKPKNENATKDEIKAMMAVASSYVKSAVKKDVKKFIEEPVITEK